MKKETENLIKQAEKVYLNNFSKDCWFERAIFLSWYCSLGDCTFCYMSTQKSKIKNPQLAKRRLSSILAEIIISKKLGWKIEFLSSGYGAYTSEEISKLVKYCFEATKEKLWLNIGYLEEKSIKEFLPYIKGISVSIETVNWDLRKKVCPSKHSEPMLKTLKLAEQYQLKKAITIIIGLGETLEDLNKLFKFIYQYKIDRVTFYALNPHKGTPFTIGPETEYYLQWIVQTRIKFPKIEIITGSWVNRLEELHLLLQAGANGFTKFPALKLFDSSYAKRIEAEVKTAHRVLNGSMTSIKKINWEKEINSLNFDSKLKEQIFLKLKQYLKRMSAPE